MSASASSRPSPSEFGRCKTRISGQRVRMPSTNSGGGFQSENELRTQITSFVSWGFLPRLVDDSCDTAIRFLFRGTQIAPRHLFWFGDSENTEERRRDVAERAAGLEQLAVILAHKQERDGIGRMVGVRAAGYRINHSFGVAVVG